MHIMRDLLEPLGSLGRFNICLLYKGIGKAMSLVIRHGIYSKSRSSNIDSLNSIH